ncbi:hypothetical protein ISS07_02195, partial [Candidatus Woesearchaeota archaeon]|nr:hypothetical protein [Candidatus Woesearchaeota archaeon]
KVDYDKLKNSETQLKFVETLRDHYLEAAKKSLGAKDVEGELEEELLIQAYTGVTSQFFKDQISKKKHGYSIDEHKGVVDELRDVQDKELEGVIYGRIKEEHIPELVKRLGISDYVDTDKMRVEEVKQLAQIYFKSNESIAPKSLEGNHFYKEKKKAA